VLSGCASAGTLWFVCSPPLGTYLELIRFLTGAQTFWSTNGHYYQYVSGSVNFDTALNSAASMSYLGFQGHLVTITSAEENAFVIALAAGNSFWIAGSDAQQEGVWRWVAGPENGQIIRPTFWARGEPNDLRGEDCLGYWSRQRSWNDFSDKCNSLSIVVEYECSFTPPPGSPCARMPL
jgi:hypothetical protein